MKTNFRIKDIIAVEWEDNYADLHNCFDFVGISDDPIKNKIKFRWGKSKGDWVNEDEFLGLTIVCSAIKFKSYKKGEKTEYPDDAKCLSIISFSSQELRDSNDTFETKETPDKGDDFVMYFQDGTVYKVNCEEVTLLATK